MEIRRRKMVQKNLEQMSKGRNQKTVTASKQLLPFDFHSSII